MFRNGFQSFLEPFLVVIFVLSIVLLQSTSALRFHLPANDKRCLKEEMRKGIMLTGDYELTDSPGVRTDLSVTDTKGHIVYKRENCDKGKFTLSTDDDDIFDFCFTSYLQSGQHLPTPREVYLTMKHGVESKDYTNLANVQKLKPLEVELQKLEDLSAAIVGDFTYMKQREQEMRDTNESTNNRIFYLSIFSMLCLLGLASWQIIFLRQFFKAKKLIE